MLDIENGNFSNGVMFPNSTSNIEYRTIEYKTRRQTKLKRSIEFLKYRLEI